MRLWSMSIIACVVLLTSCERQDEPPATAPAISADETTPDRSEERIPNGGERASDPTTKGEASPAAPAQRPAGDAESTAAEAGMEPPPAVEDEGIIAVQEFADTLATAINANDEEQYYGLLHTDCASEITNDNRHFFDELFSQNLARTVADSYEWKLVAVDPDSVSTFGGMYTYPVIPTHAITIMFLNDLGQLETIPCRIAPDGKRMGLVVPIPSDDALVRFNQSEPGIRRLKVRIDRLLASMDGALLLTVKDLIRSGKFQDAVDHYCQESGQPRHIAWEVLRRMNVAGYGP